MSFQILLILALAGLAGPLLALFEHRFVPVMVGEVLAGVLIGDTGLRAVQPHNATLSFFGEVGFAMLMLTAGMHLPLRDPRLPASLRGGAVLAVLVAAFAVPAGVAAAAIGGTSHAAVYAVVLASGSAAVLLPAFEEMKGGGRTALVVMAQITIADVATIVSVPIVLQPARAGHALLGSALVATAVIALLVLLRRLQGRAWVGQVRRLSKQRHWALDLRLALVMLFGLAFIAQKSGTSVLVAGFGAGVLVALQGGPKRLSTQVRGVAEGFFVPLYFVLLGAQLDLRGLLANPSIVSLMLALVGFNVLIHLLASSLRHLPPSAGMTACAQLGVPAAVASLGLAAHALSGPIAAAIVASSLVSLAVCTVGLERLLSRPPPELATAARSSPASP